MDPIAQFKDTAKKTWSGFAALEMMTATAAPRLVRHARIRSGQDVLDVACGTGVVAITAARQGAKVHGIDLTPELVVRARQNAALAEVPVEFVQGDAEALPFPDASFDVVVSQFGHIFAPRSQVVTKELLRVLRPGGTLAFSTWPPEHYVGRFFQLMGRYAPPPPPGVEPPHPWGDPNIVRERLGEAVHALSFARDVMWLHALSPGHVLAFMEQDLGPMKRVAEMLDAQKLAELRRDVTALVTEYFDDNRVRQDYLLTRATKR